MQNKYIKFLIIFLAIVIVVPQVALASWWNPFSWGIWNSIFHFQKTEQKQEVPVPVIVGGDKDAHGCIGSAGYTWCEVKQKCLRSWEEKCEATIPVVDPTAGWKTYTNSEYGFEVQYPKDFKIIVNNSNIPNELGISIYSGEQSGCASSADRDCWFIRMFNKDNSQYYNYYGSSFYELFNPRANRIIKDVKIAGINGKKVQISIETPPDILPYNANHETRVVYFIEKENLSLFFEYYNYGKFENYDFTDFDKMLSTFKFTK